jgi:restriction system-associated AAA family ATPase
MKLLRLKLNTDFRSLQAGFEIYFLRDFDKAKLWDFMPYCFVGRNGSGKSNILEALAAIFYHIECIYLDYKPEYFADPIAEHFKDSPTLFEVDTPNEAIDGSEESSTKDSISFFNAKQCKPDAFELEYLFPVDASLYNESIVKKNFQSKKEYNAHIYIEKKANERPVIKWLNRNDFVNENEAHEVLNRIEIRKFLPDFIIGYSSGENEILSLPFFKMRFIHYDEYEDSLRNETGYSQPEGRLVYLDTSHSQAVFLTNYLMQDETILKPVFNAIGVKAIKQFRIIIRQSVPIAKYKTESGTSALAQGELEIDNVDVFELTYNLQRRPNAETKDLKAIDKLKSCATTQFFDAENKVLYLDYYIDKVGEMKKAFQTNFEDAFELFRTFQILLTLNLYDVDIKLKQDLYKSSSLYVTETVPILPSDKRILRFKDFIIEKDNTRDDILSKALSDGEHQYLHAMGICLLFKNSHSLFLLDEPETHFNPDWRAKFISTLRDCLEKDESNKDFMRELLITSHSPFIISDSHEENVLVFKKDSQTGVVTAERPGFNTFGASVNQITLKVFEKHETIGNYAKESLDELYSRLECNEDKEKLISEAYEKLGDSVERILFVNQASKK